MPNARFYSSIAAVTNLQATIGPADISIQVASSVGFPGTFPFTLALDYGGANEELVDVTAGGPSIFAVTRAVDGTSASTHNAGAVVRHTSSARDFTESRTHEASNTSVHGITGNFVDTLSSQTLANKTLTSPVVNSGTLNGAIGGTATFSASFTFTGGPQFTTAAPAFRGAAATSIVQKLSVNGDTFDRLAVQADGKNLWSSGSLAPDTTLYRGAADVLQTDDAFYHLGEDRGIRPLATDTAYRAQVTGDANGRLVVRADGRHLWGDGTLAGDTTLYRDSTNVLKTDGNFTAGSLSATNAEVTGTLIAGTVNANLVTNAALGIAYKPVQSGSNLINFTAQTSWTEPVVFPVAFSGQPRMSINIASGSGSTTRWGARAINVTSAGFTIFVFRGDATDPAETWTNIPVHWTATSQ